MAVAKGEQALKIEYQQLQDLDKQLNLDERTRRVKATEIAQGNTEVQQGWQRTQMQAVIIMSVGVAAGAFILAVGWVIQQLQERQHKVWAEQIRLAQQMQQQQMEQERQYTEMPTQPVRTVKPIIKPVPAHQHPPVPVAKTNGKQKLPPKQKENEDFDIHRLPLGG